MRPRFDIIIMCSLFLRLQTKLIRRARRMHIFSAQPTSCKASHAIDSMKRSDPLIVRKKFEMSDTFYRKGCPDRALMKTEFSTDTEISVALLVGIGAAVVLMCAVHGWRKRKLLKKYEQMKYKSKHET